MYWVRTITILIAYSISTCLCQTAQAQSKQFAPGKYVLPNNSINSINIIRMQDGKLKVVFDQMTFVASPAGNTISYLDKECQGCQVLLKLNDDNSITAQSDGCQAYYCGNAVQCFVKGTYVLKETGRPQNSDRNSISISGVPKIEQGDEGGYAFIAVSGKDYTIWSDDLSYSYKLPTAQTKKYLDILQKATGENRPVTVQAEFSTSDNKLLTIDFGKPFKISYRDKSGKEAQASVTPPSTQPQQAKGSPPPSSPPTRSEQASGQSVQALHILKAFVENEVGADKTYKGKRIAVQGVVKEVSRSLLGGYVIVVRPSMLEQGLNVAFGGNQNALTTDIYFYFVNANDKMTSLRGGDDVVIEGMCHGKSLKALGNIGFEDSTVIKAPAR